MQQARQIKYKGKTYSLRGLAEVAGMSYATLRSRLNGGWDVEKAVTTPVSPTITRRWPFHGKLMTAPELAAIHGHISSEAMRNRLMSGMSAEQAVAEPLTKGGRFIRRKEDVEKPKVVPEPGWVPHDSPEDIRKCKKCQYSEKDSGGKVLCAFIILHDPPERRGCEPGKNCTRFAPNNKATDRKKLDRWMGAINQ